MITVACCAFVGFFLLYCLDQIGAVDWLFDAIEIVLVLLVVTWPIWVPIAFFGIGFRMVK